MRLSTRTLVRFTSALAILLTSATNAGAQVEGDADALHEEIARADSAFFDALFARCDAEHALGWLAEDAEFYDDRTGVSAGDDLRDDFRRLAANCPADNGVRRVLLPGTVEVHAIPGFGAVQTGEHHFVERGASQTTVARFIHTWRRVDGEWRLARIISLHQVVDAAEAAQRRQ